MFERIARRLRVVTGCVLGCAALSAPVFATGHQASDLLVSRCGACHVPGTDGWPERIGGQRKTPEGWLMTLVRMRLVHGVKISREEQRRLVFELSEGRGLAPSESAPWRYILERQPGVEEPFDPLISPLCARCHSRARTGLQRRTQSEWEALVHFHVGQYPTLEYQGFARDRDWWGLALNRAVPALGQRYPFRSKAWRQWVAQSQRSVAGEWLFSGEETTGDGLVGRIRLVPAGASASDGYRVTGSLTRVAARVSASRAQPERKALALTGRVRLYGGFEWRASLRFGAQRWRQVGAASPDGAHVAGRQFMRGQAGLGGRFRFTRLTQASASGVALWPRSAPLNTEVELMLVGGAKARLDVPEGIEVLTEESVELGRRIVVRASRAGVLRVQGQPQVYAAFFDRPDRIDVEPRANLARVGGGGARVVAKAAGFRAEAWANGADGMPRTADDVRLGPVPARWSMSGWDAEADALGDTQFAGRLDASTGVFLPAPAGPNPLRRRLGGGVLRNNHGNLRITATWQGLRANAQLIVTAPRWNDPPIH